MKKIIILLALLTSAVHAEIGSTDIRGFYTAVKDDKKPFSPVNGYNWFLVGIIENMYRFGNDGDKLIRDAFGSTGDATIKLVKELFYLQPDGVTFDVTYAKGKPATYFTAETIGKILAYIDATPIDDAAFEEGLTAIIKSYLPGQVDEAKKRIDLIGTVNKRIQKLKTQKEKSESDNAKLQKDEGEVARLTAEAVALYQQVDPAVTDYEKVRDLTKSLSSDPAKLASLIKGSLQEMGTEPYVQYAPHQILLGFLWKKATTKDDFGTYFKQFNPSILTMTPEEVLGYTPFEQREINEFGITLEEKANDIESCVKLLENNYEKASIFLSATKTLYPIVRSCGNSQYRGQQFSNCGEASLRGFFYYLTYNPTTKKFDVDTLKSNSALTIKPELIAYLQTHNNIDSINTQPYHDDWNEMVSNLSGVKYNRTIDGAGYNISSKSGGLKNMLQVMNVLLLGNNQDFARMSPEEQLAALMQKLNLTCRLENDQDGTQTVLFLKNDQGVIKWVFMSGHFYLEYMMSSTAQMKMADALFKFYVNHNKPLTSYNLLGWFGEVNYRGRGSFIFNESLQNTDMRIDMMERLLYKTKTPAYKKIICLKLLKTWKDFNDSQLFSVLGSMHRNNAGSWCRDILEDIIKTTPLDTIFSCISPLEEIMRKDVPDVKTWMQSRIQKIPLDINTIEDLARLMSNSFSPFGIREIVGEKFLSSLANPDVSPELKKKIYTAILNHNIDTLYDHIMPFLERDNIADADAWVLIIRNNVQQFYEILQRKLESFSSLDLSKIIVAMIQKERRFENFIMQALPKLEQSHLKSILEFIEIMGSHIPLYATIKQKIESLLATKTSFLTIFNPLQPIVITSELHDVVMHYLST